MNLVRNFKDNQIDLVRPSQGGTNEVKSMKYILLTILFLCLVATHVQAVAIKVFPSEIKIETESGVSIKKEILIENPSANVALYEVYADNFSDWVKLKPESFT